MAISRQAAPMSATLGFGSIEQIVGQVSRQAVNSKAVTATRLHCKVTNDSWLCRRANLGWLASGTETVHRTAPCQGKPSIYSPLAGQSKANPGSCFPFFPLRPHLLLRFYSLRCLFCCLGRRCCQFELGLFDWKQSRLLLDRKLSHKRANGLTKVMASNIPQNFDGTHTSFGLLLVAHSFADGRANRAHGVERYELHLIISVWLLSARHRQLVRAVDCNVKAISNSRDIAEMIAIRTDPPWEHVTWLHAIYSTYRALTGNSELLCVGSMIRLYYRITGSVHTKQHFIHLQWQKHHFVWKFLSLFITFKKL